MSAPHQSTNSFMVRVYNDLYTCSASFKRTLEPTCDEGRYWHSGLQQAFYFIVSGRYWSGRAPRSFVGKPLVRWRNWIAFNTQDIHDAVCIMDASRKAQLGHPFKVIDLTQDDKVANPIIDLTDEEEDHGVWKGVGSAEDPFVLNDEEEFVLVSPVASDVDAPA